MVINTVDDWWTLVDDNWPNLIDLAHRFRGFDLVCLVPAHVVGGIITLVHTNLQAMTLCKRVRDRQLARFLNGIWAAAPDKSFIHDLTGWHVLCDLCSEEWVFDEEKNHDN